MYYNLLPPYFCCMEHCFRQARWVINQMKSSASSNNNNNNTKIMINANNEMEI